MRIKHIVFYGTLRRGYPKHRELGLRRALSYIGKRTIVGELYDLGAYPGLLEGAGQIDVELYRIVDATVLRRLDLYEGYDARRPEHSLFVRGSTSVAPTATPGPALCRAWVYRFNGVVEGRKRIARADGGHHSVRRRLSRRAT